MATLGQVYKFSIYGRKWGENNTYDFTLLKGGWHVARRDIAGDCDASGAPFLFDNFTRDNINFPSNLSTALSLLHEDQDVLSDDQVQAELTKLADWVSASEKATPSMGFWKGRL
jgi:hypothetical protein